jgi:hypothetical protein
MNKVKTYEQFINEEINWRKGLATAAIGASLLGGMTSCNKEVIEPNQIETTQEQTFKSFGGEWKISKTVQGGGQSVTDPNPDFVIKFITKYINSRVDSQTITVDNGFGDTHQYNIGEYTNEEGDLIITDGELQKIGTYKITTFDDEIFGKYPVLEIIIDNKSLKFTIGSTPNFNNGFQLAGPDYGSISDYTSIFGVDKSIMLKRI